jgi:hypothetical protein
MADATMKELLVRLHATLSGMDRLDPTLMGLVRELDTDIQRLLKSESTGLPAPSLAGRAAELETRFATDHPRAERVLREIVEALERMGV